MNNFKTSLSFGVALGVALSLLLSFLTDLIIFIVYRVNGKRLLDADAVFILGVAAPVILARIWNRKDGKHEVNKGLLLAAFIWGLIFVYLFQISSVKSIFFSF